MYKELLILVCAIAAINWGLVAGLGINAVEIITPEGTMLRQVREPAYIVIGVVGLVVLIELLGLIKL